MVRDRWRILESTIGIVCLIRFGEAPAHVPDREVERLKAMVDERTGLVRLPDKPPPAPKRVFKKGEKVRIIGGAFDGLRAIHSGMRAGDRERILLALLGSSARPVMIPSHLVHAA